MVSRPLSKFANGNSFACRQKTRANATARAKPVQLPTKYATLDSSCHNYYVARQAHCLKDLAYAPASPTRTYDADNFIHDKRLIENHLIFSR
jgi:hypothetical protein